MAITVREEVATKLAERAPSVRSTIVDSMVEDKLKEQANAVLACMRNLDAAKIDVRKIKPTSPGFDLSGSELPGFYTKEQLDQKKAAEKKVADLEEALDEAIGAGVPQPANAEGAENGVRTPKYDFTKVLKLGKGGDKAEKSDK